MIRDKPSEQLLQWLTDWRRVLGRCLNPSHVFITEESGWVVLTDSAVKLLSQSSVTAGPEDKSAPPVVWHALSLLFRELPDDQRRPGELVSSAAVCTRPRLHQRSDVQRQERPAQPRLQRYHALLTGLLRYVMSADRLACEALDLKQEQTSTHIIWLQIFLALFNFICCGSISQPGSQNRSCKSQWRQQPADRQTESRWSTRSAAEHMFRQKQLKDEDSCWSVTDG